MEALSTKQVYRCSWLYMPGFLLLFSMLFVPTTYQNAKIVLLIYLIAAILLGMLTNSQNFKIHRSVLLWVISYVLIGSIWIAIGYYRGLSNALTVVTVYVMWPILFTLLISGLTKEWLIKGLVKTISFSAIAIILYSFLYIFKSIGIIPSYIFISIDMGQIFAVHEGYVGYRLFNINTMPFLIPFFFTAALLGKKQNIIKNYTCWIILILLISLAILSSRRVLLLIIMISPLVVIFFNNFLPREIKVFSRKRSTIIIISYCLLVILVMTVFVMQYGFQLEVIVERFISAFKILSGGDASAEFRGNQLIELLNGWTKKPIFGSGYGATITFLGQEYSSFELSYVATLYHTGLIGFTLYLLLFIWLFLNCFKLISETEPISIWLFPISIALFCFMIANATNPYLQKFDYMWVIFLPLAFINYLQLKKREKIRRVEERLAS